MLRTLSTIAILCTALFLTGCATSGSLKREKFQEDTFDILTDTFLFILFQK